MFGPHQTRDRLDPVGVHWLRGPSGVHELRYPAGSVVVVGGVSGAGKTTLIRRVVAIGSATVLDSETVRERYVRRLGRGRRLAAPLIRLEHLVRVGIALSSPHSAVLHLRHTRRLPRVALAAAARVAGHPCHLLFIDVARETAESGQRLRGRRVRGRAFERDFNGALRLRERLAAAAPGRNPLAGEGYRSCVVLDRAAARELGALRFAG